MNTLQGVIYAANSGNYTIIEKTPISKFVLNLGDKVESWELGIDPATHYSGLAIRSKNKDFVILLDCERDNRSVPEKYYEDMFYLLKRLFKGHRVHRVILEKPFNSRYVHTTQVLLALRGKVEEWIRDIPELSEAETARIYPNTWKSRVVNKKKGNGRYNQKGSVAEDLCDIYPGLREYMQTRTSGDYDSFDALGILVGYEMYAYTSDGEKKICGDKGAQHVSYVGYKWVAEDNITGDFVPDTLGPVYQLVKPEFLDYNTDYTFNDNVNMATANYDAVVTIVPESQLQQFQWKFGIDISEKNHALLMFIFRKGHYSISTFKAIQSRFEMDEEVGS